MVRGGYFHIIPRLEEFFFGRFCSLDIIFRIIEKVMALGNLLGIFLFK